MVCRGVEGRGPGDPLGVGVRRLRTERRPTREEEKALRRHCLSCGTPGGAPAGLERPRAGGV